MADVFTPPLEFPNRAVDHFATAPTTVSLAASTYRQPSMTYPVLVKVQGSSTAAIRVALDLSEDAVTPTTVDANSSGLVGANAYASVTVIVPPGYYYRYVDQSPTGTPSWVVTEVPIADEA